MKAKISKFYPPKPKKPFRMPFYPKMSRANRAKVGRRRVYTKGPGAHPLAPRQPEFRPVTGYGADQPVPPIMKVEYRYIPRPKHFIPGYKRRVRCHRYLINLPEPEWELLVKAARGLDLPVAYVIRLAVRRFVRHYNRYRITDPVGNDAPLLSRKNLLTRAEEEILGGVWRGRNGRIMAINDLGRKIMEKRNRERLIREVEGPREIIPPKPKRPVPPQFRSESLQRMSDLAAQKEREWQQQKALNKLTAPVAQTPPDPPPLPSSRVSHAAARSLSPAGRRLFIVPKEPKS